MATLSKYKYPIAIFCTTILCLITNLILQTTIINATLNSTILLGILLTTCKIFKDTFQKINPIFIPILGIIPLFSESFENPYTLTIALTITLLFYCFLKYRFKIIPAVIIIFLVFIGNLLAGSIITFPFIQVDWDKTIFSIKDTPKYVEDFQELALFLPYRTRNIVFNLPTSYLYQDIQNSLELFSLNSLYQSLLLVNLYPLILGIINLKLTSKEKLLYIGSFAAMILTIGLSRSPNTFGSFILISPFLLTWIILGMSRVNIFAYTSLFILSLVLLTSPIT